MASKELVKSLVDRLTRVENEMKLLREDRKEIFDDFKDKLDLKAFRAAWAIVKKENLLTKEISMSFLTYYAATNKSWGFS